MGRKGTNRNEIVDNAIVVMDKTGLSKFQLSDVAKYMNIKTPSLYNHFDGMQDLLRSIQIRANEMLFDYMVENAKGLKGKEAFKALCHSYRNFFLKHKGVYETLTRPMDTTDKELVGATFKLVGPITQIFKNISMDDDYGVHVMRVIRCSLHGFASLEAQGNMVLDTSADGSFDLLLEILLTSLSKDLSIE